MAEISSNSFRVSGTPASDAMARRCSTALVEPPDAATDAMALCSDSRVMICFGRMSSFRRSHHELAAIEGDFALARIGGGDFVGAHRRNSEESDCGGHGVGGELAAARASAGAGFVFEFAELLDGHFSGSAGADGFEDVQNRDVAAVVVSGENRAAVERKGRDIQTRESHHGAGDRLVAATDGDDGVEGVRADEEFDGIGDHFARNQRSFHAFGAHGDAVGDGDGVKLDGSAAGGADACFDAFGELAQMEIARSDFGPSVGDGDERAGEIVVGEAGGFEHGPGGGAREAFFYDVTLHDDFGSPLGRINQKSPVTVDLVRGAAPRYELGGWPAPDNYYDEKIENFFHGLACRRTPPLPGLRCSRSGPDPRQRKRRRCKGQ